MKIVFMGTPDFAQGVLRELYESKKHEILAVVTQPDKPKGRSGKLTESAVKQYAVSKGIEVFQPAKIKEKESVEYLRKYDADIFVVAAFGQIVSKEILDMPRFGCVNVHASLLPKYRGAAPIQYAIADGLNETGVTIQQMNEGVDTGDILGQKVVAISDDETGESLFDKLMKVSGPLLLDTLDRIEDGSIVPTPQNEEEATHVGLIKKEMGRINFLMDADVIERRIRAFTPWPGGFTIFNGKLLKITKCRADMSVTDIAIPGTVREITKDRIDISCVRGILSIYSLQPEGKKNMTAHDYLLGNKIKVGDVLG